MNDEIKLLTPDEVCELIGISRWKLNQLRRNGKFCPAISFGSETYRWQLSDLSEWLDEQSKKGKSK